jgi:hypothetical protein
MAKRPPAVYAPGELDRTRRNLGDLDVDEAKRIAGLLGGDIGVERAAMPAKPARRRAGDREETVDLTVGGQAPQRRTPAEEETRQRAEESGPPVRPNYRERVKMDRFAALPEYEIKTSAQAMRSMLALFRDPPDFINPGFTTKRMNEYYDRLQSLVAATRILLPRNDLYRQERFAKSSPFSSSVIGVVRDWNIEQIARELGRLQAKPREVVASDFAEIIRCFYKPLARLERLDPEAHIKEAYVKLYRTIAGETGEEPKPQYAAAVKTALAAYAGVLTLVRQQLYPLLLKLVSDRWLSYDDFFRERRRRIAAFLGVEETQRLNPADAAADAAEPEAEDAVPAGAAAEGAEPAGEGAEPAVPATEAEAEAAAEDAPSFTYTKAAAKGLATLEALFPEAGWPAANTFPDLFPYFQQIFDLKKGCELIAPDDPMHQVVVLVHVLEELFYGLRYVAFGTLTLPNGSPEHVDEGMNRIIAGWHDFIETGLGKEYLPRLIEYCRILEGSAESRTSVYAKRTLAELLWVKRLNFLPFFRFDSILSAPPFRRPPDVRPFYVEVRELRRLLTAVARNIEAVVASGGPSRFPVCQGIDNPWEPYVFQVPNPVSMRLDALLGGKGSKRRTNAALVYYSLAAATVLDSLINDALSWGYSGMGDYPFRSENGQGAKPAAVAAEPIDVEAIFRRSLKPAAGQPAPSSAPTTPAAPAASGGAIPTPKP